MITFLTWTGGIVWAFIICLILWSLLEATIHTYKLHRSRKYIASLITKSAESAGQEMFVRNILRNKISGMK